jgi:ATP-dependent Clp protease ATP-binding subunit ClpC
MKLVLKYLQLHFLKGPKEIIRITVNFLIFIFHYFSIGLLFRTLFAHWKRIYLEKTVSGFIPSEWLNRLSFNVISRGIGFLVRVIIIFLGLIMEIFVLVLGMTVLGIWLVLPFFSLLLFTGWLLKKEEKVEKAGLTRFLEKRLAGILLEDVSEEDKKEITRWFERVQKEISREKRFWELENLLAIPGIGKDWAAGYTLHLDKYVIDLAAPKPYSSHLVGRQREAKKLEESLASARKKGCLLVGEPGVGKQTIVENFAKKSREGKTLPQLERKRVLLLDLTSVIGETKTKDEAKKRVLELLREAGQAGNVILVIENFDRLVTSQEGGIDFTGVFVQAIEETGLLMIGLTTPDNFQKFIFPNKKILEYLEKIEVSSPTKAEALEILENILPYFEKRAGVTVTFPALKEIINQSDRWVIEIPFPEKAIALLDDSLVYAQTNLKVKNLKPEHVRAVLADKTKIPLKDLSDEERKRLQSLEEVLHQRVVNQDVAIKEIAKALRRKKTGVAPGKRPIGTFLFLGPTGVGKTETAKALAEVLFGSDEKMIRLDMASFKEAEASERMIGSFEQKEPGILTSAVRQRPYSVLLLDEIEKASISVQNLFLTAIDEGYLTDAFGKKTNFENLLIIGTSNAGAEYIRERLEEGMKMEDLAPKLVDFVLRQNLFSPEFLNRFDAVVVYRPLGHQELIQIARLMLNKLNQRLASKKISLEITDRLVEKLAELGFDPAFGARPMRRVIADKIEDVIAKKLLAGEIKQGDKVKIYL